MRARRTPRPMVNQAPGATRTCGCVAPVAGCVWPPTSHASDANRGLAHVSTFQSTTFDIASEPPNPINPIVGESILRWLRERLRQSPYETTDPAPEDWG